MKWFKSAGDAVKPGDNLFEIETDKTSMEVPATFGGTLTRDPLSGRRGGQGRRRGGGDRRRRGARQAAPSAAAPAKAPAAPPRAAASSRGTRCRPRPHRAQRRSILSTKCARPSAISARPNLPGGDFHHAAGAPARRRARHRPFACHRLRPARPHRRRDVAMAAPAGPGHGNWRQRRAGQGAVRRHRLRGSAARSPCAAPSRRGWSRPSRPSRISI